MILSQSPSMKQAQLQIAASWPNCPEKRIELTNTLEKMKHPSHRPVGLVCSWEYVSGFFDAEGYIKIPTRSTSVNLEFTQNNRHILDSIHAFLQVEQEGKWRSVSGCSGQAAHKLCCYNSAVSRQALRHFLTAGLTVKRAGTVAGRFKSHGGSGRPLADVRQSIKYLRLDSKGAMRAVQIKRLADKLRLAKAGGICELVLKQELQLYQLRQTHRFERVLSQISALRSDIRGLLKSGAKLARPTLA
ncbi:unnamed protein product [Polarella glacialis]|uniref:Homing endonuclease LAGLIDADG domain-containing protein n=1 Tax=Polarella glacialis TaxID=89957 RepID=A0A813GD50_POLGL|nr:unnamed protein product [Polarella glacialis]